MKHHRIPLHFSLLRTLFCFYFATALPKAISNSPQKVAGRMSPLATTGEWRASLMRQVGISSEVASPDPCCVNVAACDVVAVLLMKRDLFSSWIGLTTTGTFVGFMWKTNARAC